MANVRGKQRFTSAHKMPVDEWFAGVEADTACEGCGGVASAHVLTVSGGSVKACAGPRGCEQFQQGRFRTLVAPAQPKGDRGTQIRLFPISVGE